MLACMFVLSLFRLIIVFFIQCYYSTYIYQHVFVRVNACTKGSCLKIGDMAVFLS